MHGVLAGLSYVLQVPRLVALPTNIGRARERTSGIMVYFYWTPSSARTKSMYMCLIIRIMHAMLKMRYLSLSVWKGASKPCGKNGSVIKVESIFEV
ncbi:hypothetical protein SCLCIDRAFT_1216285 [Scleroderma citrinum Foug A]|uniref:Uncharacterized protein n=1 Tax=Scleroderma citrinum Foug A TaxID=1036808 RepID=A0A0C3DXU2_9AGAM|nr:hypothetical protein SCLCIDRAFT_1216285 [Scleroderma citrinum Foug A]